MRKRFEERRVIDPRRANTSIDANALDRDGTTRDNLVERVESLIDAQEIHIVVAGGVLEEIGHPRTPARVKASFAPRIFNWRPGLNATQQAERQRVASILQGNAAPGKHAADASHLSEAAETGCCYFITEDARILQKREELLAALPPTLSIVTLGEYLAIYDDFIEGRRL